MNEQCAPNDLCRAKGGFEYTVETVRDGVVIDREVVKNLMPLAGLDHFLNVVLLGGTQNPAWYLAVYEGNYTPLSTDLATGLPTASTESTAYTAANRLTVSLSAPAGGVTSNAASPAEFEMNADKTIYGAYISSANGKGATTGVVISAVRFASAKNLKSGDILKVVAGFILASA